MRLFYLTFNLKYEPYIIRCETVPSDPQVSTIYPFTPGNIWHFRCSELKTLTPAIILIVFVAFCVFNFFWMILLSKKV